MERIELSQQEPDWLDWLKRARDKEMTPLKLVLRLPVHSFRPQFPRSY